MSTIQEDPIASQEAIATELVPTSLTSPNERISFPEGISPFLSPPAVATADTLALMFLRRDLIIPVYLSNDPSAMENTRFGSFPHSTLIGRPWGSQILSSHVKGTATFTKRSRQVREQVQALAGAKRKRGGAAGGGDQVGNDDGNDDSPDSRTSGLNTPNLEITQSNSGFVHLLPPTPELWTQSLPHRTQVVYTPDYSYVLSRLMVQPGSRLIEAGAGSGSFTHAATRAVFSGYPKTNLPTSSKTSPRGGKVFSYEFHELRAQQLQTEIIAHGMDNLVTLTHRDVYQGGFCFEPRPDGSVLEQPHADAIFLDLPNPWLALPHLTRTASPCALNPKRAVHICTFSPCIEQVTKTVDTMRDLGFLDISMVEIMHKNIEIRRERVGVTGPNSQNGPSNSVPQNVDEALSRLLELKQEREVVVQLQLGNLPATKQKDTNDDEKDQSSGETTPTLAWTPSPHRMIKKPSRDKDGNSQKPWLEGQIVHRAEQELKTHTSYLVFAIIPREWTAADEAKAAKKWAKTSSAVKTERIQKPVAGKEELADAENEE